MIIKLLNEFIEKYEEFNWWLPEDKSFYEKEAYKEIIKDHDLWNIELTLIAACTSCDDVLFSTDDKTKPYVIIHLIYSANKDKKHPRYRAFASCDDAIKYIEDEFVVNYLCDPNLIRERGVTI